MALDLSERTVNLRSLPIRISHDAREGFISMVKGLFSLLYIGFALVYPFIHL